MRTWFTSLSGAITFSALSLLSFVGYALMEMRYFLAKWIPGDGAAAVETIMILLIIGGWLWALFAAANGRRGGIIALLALSVFSVLIGLYDIRYFPLPWPEQTAVIGTFICAVIAIAALTFQFRQSKVTG